MRKIQPQKTLKSAERKKINSLYFSASFCVFCGSNISPAMDDDGMNAGGNATQDAKTEMGA